MKFSVMGSACMKRLKFDMYLYGTEVYVIVVWFVAMLGGLYAPDIHYAKYGTGMEHEFSVWLTCRYSSI